VNSSTSNLPAVKIFCYNGSEIRNIQDNDGKIWFVAKDIAAKLGYSEATIKSNISNLFGAVPEIWKGNKRIITPGGEQDMLCVTENGAYFFLARSDKPGALQFQMWLAGEVVPSIMHTGEYVHPAVKQAREEKPKLVAIPNDIKIYLSKANFSAQEKIIDRGIEAYYLVKNNDPNADKECQKVLALDIAFAKRTGYSALEAGGIKIEIDEKGTFEHYWNWMRINWESHYKVSFTESRLEIPEPREEEHVLDD